MITRGLFALAILMGVLSRSSSAQTVVSIVNPLNGTNFGKAVGMELNVPLQAVVTPVGKNQRVYFYANGINVASAHTDEGYSTIWTNADFGTHVITADLGGGGATSAPVTIHVQSNGIALINQSAVWKYMDDGVDPGQGWFHPDTDLSFWLSGVPQFGFGEGDERTSVRYSTPDGLVYPVYYFRHAFVLTNAASFSNLAVRLLRDDGAAVYLNGVELFRDNLPAGPLSNQTYAETGALDENVFADWWINPRFLVNGTNHIAVSIHNQGPVSHDISFDLRLISNVPVLPPGLTIRREQGVLHLSWPRSSLGYRLQSRHQLDSGSWQTVSGVSPASFSHSLTNSSDRSAHYFRLSVD